MLWIIMRRRRVCRPTHLPHDWHNIRVVPSSSNFFFSLPHFFIFIYKKNDRIKDSFKSGQHQLRNPIYKNINNINSGKLSNILSLFLNGTNGELVAWQPLTPAGYSTLKFDEWRKTQFHISSVKALNRLLGNFKEQHSISLIVSKLNTIRSCTCTPPQ